MAAEHRRLAPRNGEGEGARGADPDDPSLGRAGRKAREGHVARLASGSLVQHVRHRAGDGDAGNATRGGELLTGLGPRPYFERGALHAQKLCGPAERRVNEAAQWKLDGLWRLFRSGHAEQGDRPAALLGDQTEKLRRQRGRPGHPVVDRDAGERVVVREQRRGCAERLVRFGTELSLRLDDGGLLAGARRHLFALAGGEHHRGALGHAPCLPLGAHRFQRDPRAPAIRGAKRDRLVVGVAEEEGVAIVDHHHAIPDGAGRRQLRVQAETRADPGVDDVLGCAALGVGGHALGLRLLFLAAVAADRADHERQPGDERPAPITPPRRRPCSTGSRWSSRGTSSSGLWSHNRTLRR